MSQSTTDRAPLPITPFPYNLRFPGQYYDAETGLNQNLDRDYDPLTGSYVESDPVGLNGGSYSTYAYVGSDPVDFVDPTGLSSVVFTRNSGTIDIYGADGELLFSCEAGNLVARRSKGPFPNGTYPFAYYKRHPESGPTDGYGSHGIFIFKVPGRPGLGLHSGRHGPKSPTLGCIRTTDNCMKNLVDLVKQDPLTGITVQ